MIEGREGGVAEGLGRRGEGHEGGDAEGLRRRWAGAEAVKKKTVVF